MLFRSAALAAFKAEKKTFAIESIRLHCLSAVHQDLNSMLSKMPHIRSFTFSETRPNIFRQKIWGLTPLPNELLRQLASITAPVDLLILFSGTFDRPVRRLVISIEALHQMYRVGGTLIVRYYQMFPQLEFLSIHGPEGFLYHPPGLKNTFFSSLTKLKVLHLKPHIISIGRMDAVSYHLTSN